MKNYSQVLMTYLIAGFVVASISHEIAGMWHPRDWDNKRHDSDKEPHDKTLRSAVTVVTWGLMGTYAFLLTHCFGYCKQHEPAKPEEESKDINQAQKAEEQMPASLSAPTPVATADPQTIDELVKSANSEESAKNI